jgi:hypothetical protein
MYAATPSCRLSSLATIGYSAVLHVEFASSSRMPKKKASSVPPKLTDPERDLLSHLQQGYQLETDSLGNEPVLRRLKDMKCYAQQTPET